LVAEQARKRMQYPHHFGKDKFGKIKVSLLEANRDVERHDADGRRTMNRIFIVGKRNTRYQRIHLSLSFSATPVVSTKHHYPVVRYNKM